jgi:hypothetical protein
VKVILIVIVVGIQGVMTAWAKGRYRFETGWRLLHSVMPGTCMIGY